MKDATYSLWSSQEAKEAKYNVIRWTLKTVYMQ